MNIKILQHLNKGNNHRFCQLMGSYDGNQWFHIGYPVKRSIASFRFAIILTASRLNKEKMLVTEIQRLLNHIIGNELYDSQFSLKREWK